MAWYYRTQVSIASDTVFPRDRYVLTPWFSDTVNGNAQKLADDLRDVFVAAAGSWFNNSTEVKTSVYEWTPGDPTTGAPVATAIKNSGGTMTADAPREIALCLSFYAGANTKRRRGRLYLPVAGSGTVVASARPAPSAITRVLACGPRLAACGAASTTWCVHSDADQMLFPVTATWCDDEWDTQRRRGLRATTRTQAAVAG